ncbi:signal peptidase complex subunit 2 [Limtongia smithiae]|uniref:signal peptidase complex subunit 2 n=1 Tax=Limtongia smithiae TaxID=1125753 RepID=UPI0034CE048D
MSAPKKNKVNLSSVSDMKNATDDEIVKIFASKGYKQIFTLLDVRLLLGYLSVFVAVAAGLYDFYAGFEAAKMQTAVGVMVYFVLNVLMAAWVALAEKGIIYQGNKDGTKVSIVSTAKKFVPDYNIIVRQQAIASSEGTAAAKKSFTEFFDSQGYIVRAPLETWIDGLLETSGKSKKQK